ncbi:MAG: hypothetical protein ICV63_09250 [Coleofasciculus sp. Co-bin14]|nr:hypothetical protein [Coleofasciculus sp. Co-bin14]
MKSKLALAAILSTATVTGTVLLASVSPAQAFPCAFKSKSAGNTTSLTSPTSEGSSGIVAKKTKFKKLAIAGAGIATLGGLFTLGMAIKSRRDQKIEPVLADVGQAESFETSTFPIVVPQDALTSSTSKEEASTQELTRIG